MYVPKCPLQSQSRLVCARVVLVPAHCSFMYEAVWKVPEDISPALLM